MNVELVATILVVLVVVSRAVSFEMHLFLAPFHRHSELALHAGFPNNVNWPQLRGVALELTDVIGTVVNVILVDVELVVVKATFSGVGIRVSFPPSAKETVKASIPVKQPVPLPSTRNCPCTPPSGHQSCTSPSVFTFVPTRTAAAFSSYSSDFHKRLVPDNEVMAKLN